MKYKLLFKFLMVGPLALLSTAVLLNLGYEAVESVFFGLLTQLFFSSRLAVPETRQLMMAPLGMAAFLGVMHFIIFPKLFENADSELDKWLILALSTALFIQSILMGWHQYKILRIITSTRSSSP